MTQKELDLTLKTTKKTRAMTFELDVDNKLEDLKRLEHLNISAFINDTIKTVLTNSKVLEPPEFSQKFKDYRRINLILHKNVVALLERIVASKGYYDLALTLSYLIASNNSLQDGNPYDHLYWENSYKQAIAKLQDNLQAPDFGEKWE